jgi:hypothetical protein
VLGRAPRHTIVGDAQRHDLGLRLRRRRQPALGANGVPTENYIRQYS